MPPSARAALIGAATGARSSMGLAAIALTARSGRLTTRPARIAVAGAAGAELVIDTLPATPSRLQARGLLSRVVAGAAAGAVLARRGGHNRAEIAEAALAAAGSALGYAFIGAGWRHLAEARFGLDLPGAVIEDLVAASLAAIATTGSVR